MAITTLALLYIASASYSYVPHTYYLIDDYFITVCNTTGHAAVNWLTVLLE